MTSYPHLAIFKIQPILAAWFAVSFARPEIEMVCGRKGFPLENTGMSQLVIFGFAAAANIPSSHILTSLDALL